MSFIKTAEDIEILKSAGKRHGEILQELSSMVAPGVSAEEIEARSREMLAESGDEAAFLNYQPQGAGYPFPAATCISFNEEIVHGIPSDRVVQEGDIVSLDFGLKRKGLITDAAVTAIAGEVPERVQKLVDRTRDALYVAIDTMRVGNRVGDIGAAIEEFIQPHGFGLIRELGGHGVGHAVHEEPFVANYGTKGTGSLLRHGMVLAIEPMFTLGSPDISVQSDGYTISSADGSLSAHFEHTVVITDDGPLIVTEV